MVSTTDLCTLVNPAVLEDPNKDVIDLLGHSTSFAITIPAMQEPRKISEKEAIIATVTLSHGPLYHSWIQH